MVLGKAALCGSRRTQGENRLSHFLARPAYDHVFIYIYIYIQWRPSYLPCQFAAKMNVFLKPSTGHGPELGFQHKFSPLTPDQYQIPQHLTKYSFIK